MILKGTVRNVVDFGVFVDIGIKNDGLVHKSQMSNKFVKDPMEICSVGDIIDVKVIGIDLENLNIEFKFEESFWEGETSSRVSTKIWEKDFPIEKIEEYPLYKECFTHVNGLELSCKYDFVHTGTIPDHELGVPQWNGMEDAGIYGWDLD